MGASVRLGVSADKQREVEERLAGLGVRPGDLQERFVRSQGPGGQNVNKVATAVVLRHIPSGIEVKAQQSRSQALNRYYARRMLAEQLEAKQLGAAAPRQRAAQKKAKQKSRRARRSRAKKRSCAENESNQDPPGAPLVRGRD